YNRANLVASPPARATVTGGAPAVRAAPRLFVLTVGVNNYADPRFRLVYAVPDSKSLAEALTQAGKGLYEEVIVTAVHDADVSGNKLDATFNALAARMRASDVFAFFAAGHGKTLDGRYYFIPQSFKPAGATATMREIQTQGIAQEQWQ